MANRLPVELLRESLTKPWVLLRVFQGTSTLSRVPEHYKKFFWEWKCAPKTPVHYIPNSAKFEKLPSGVILPVQTNPLPVLQPKELHQGIWGGETIIKGYTKKKRTVRRFPRYWVPTLKSTVVYSEILNRYMTVTVTERALKLIDEHYGFDSYILKTSAGDLMSELALRLKREMLLTLVRGTLYPDDLTKKEEILKKYQQYIISEEEADWYGLNAKEAATKQKILEEAVKAPKPLKHAFRAEFIQYLKMKQQDPEDKDSLTSTSWLSKVNPFAKK